MKDIKFEEVQSLLDGGKQPEEIFDWVGSSYNGFRVVGLNYKRNYIDENNKLLSKKWFDTCCGFSDWFGVVEINDKSNYIKFDGTFLSEQWFDMCYDFSNGLGKVELDGKEYKIDKDGNVFPFS